MKTCCVLLTLSDFTKLRLKKRPKPSPSPPWFFQYWCQNSFTFFLTYIPHDIFPDDSLCLLTLLLDTPRPTKLLNFHWRQVRRRIFFLISITQSCIYHQVVRWNFCCFFLSFSVFLLNLFTWIQNRIYLSSYYLENQLTMKYIPSNGTFILVSFWYQRMPSPDC